MMYAGSKSKLFQTAELTKVIETRNTEDLAEERYGRNLDFSINMNICVSKAFMY